MQCQPIGWFLFDINFHRNFFSEQASEIWILIVIIPIIHAKKIYTKYDKIFIFEKNPHKNYHCEKKSRVE